MSDLPDCETYCFQRSYKNTNM